MKNQINISIKESENEMKSPNEFPFTELNEDQFYFRAKENLKNIVDPGDFLLIDKNEKIEDHSLLYLKTKTGKEIISTKPVQKIEDEITEYYPITGIFKAIL